MGKNAKQRVRQRLGLVRARPHELIADFCRHFVGGKALFMQMAKHAAKIKPHLAYVAEAYESLPETARKVVSIDALCRKYGIDPTDYIRVVGEAALRYEENGAILIVAELHGPVALADLPTFVEPTHNVRTLPSFERTILETDEILRGQK